MREPRQPAGQGGRKWHLDAGGGIAGCGRANLQLRRVSARLVAPRDRCQAPGCAEAWPPALRSVG